MGSYSSPDKGKNDDVEAQSMPSVHKGKRKDRDGSGTSDSSFKQPKAPSVAAPKDTRSTVWAHFKRTENNRNKCNCIYCGKLMSCLTISGTSNLIAHLASCKHHKAWNEKEQQNIDQDGGDGSLKLVKVSKEVFREATNEMLVLGELPLSFVESIAFRHFCNKCKLYQPHSRRTATRDIVEFYVKKKEALKKIFKSNKQRVSLTTDIWVAPTTGASYMVITIHFIDAGWKLRKFIIGFKNITDHKGSTISAVLLECLAEWGIERIFTITVDNATTNTSALKRFKDAFRLVGDDSLVLSGVFMHMRCAAHILNLIVKEGLESIDSSVSAIRNAIQYVRSSSSRLNSFQLRVDNGKLSRGSLPMDTKTRWNSTYLMLTRGIKFRVAFDKMVAEDKLYNDYFLEHEKDGTQRTGPPTSNDWDACDRLVSFLVIFYNSTLEVSASTKVCAHKCYDEIVTVEMNLSELCLSSDLKLRTKAYEMRGKLDKYWEGLKNINKLLIVASVFDPTNKMQLAKACFEQLYGEDSEETKKLEASIEVILKQLFEEYSNRRDQCQLSLSQAVTQVSCVQAEEHGNLSEKIDVAADIHGRNYKRMRSMYKEKVKENGSKNMKNELQIYLKEDVEEATVFLGTDYDILSWWRVNIGRYPILSELAKDVLAMQVSSVASESAFSTSGRILDPYRSSLEHLQRRC